MPQSFPPISSSNLVYTLPHPSNLGGSVCARALKPANTAFPSALIANGELEPTCVREAQHCTCNFSSSSHPSKPTTPSTISLNRLERRRRDRYVLLKYSASAKIKTSCALGSRKQGQKRRNAKKTTSSRTPPNHPRNSSVQAENHQLNSALIVVHAPSRSAYRDSGLQTRLAGR